uniref:Uncharacterized protein n=1 Tax=Sphaerodactylus townsendi TaxID=933632 RepID=A0ACB8E6C6_9SAUR
MDSGCTRAKPTESPESPSLSTLPCSQSQPRDISAPCAGRGGDFVELGAKSFGHLRQSRGTQQPIRNALALWEEVVPPTLSSASRRHEVGCCAEEREDSRSPRYSPEIFTYGCIVFCFYLEPLFPQANDVKWELYKTSHHDREVMENVTDTDVFS